MAMRLPRGLWSLLVVAFFSGQPPSALADPTGATQVQLPSRPWRSIAGLPDPPFGIDTTHEIFAASGQNYDYHGCRVDPGGYPPGPPTDPDVQDSMHPAPQAHGFAA